MLDAAFSLYKESDDIAEFQDTVSRLAGRWRALPGPHRHLLSVLGTLLQNNMLTASEVDFLDGLVYSKDPVLTGLFQSIKVTPE